MDIYCVYVKLMNHFKLARYKILKHFWRENLLIKTGNLERMHFFGGYLEQVLNYNGIVSIINDMMGSICRIIT